MPADQTQTTGLAGVPASEVADMLRRLASGDLTMRLTPDFGWFKWEDMDPAGPFEVEAGGYVIRFDKGWDVARGLESIRASDGRETVWELGWDFSPALTAEEYDSLMAKLRRLGHDG